MEPVAGAARSPVPATSITMNERQLTPSQMRYLVAIYLEGDGMAVRSVDIASSLRVTKASVATMLKDLMEFGLVTKEPYGDVFLTDYGLDVAKRLASKQQRIAQVLSEHLTLDERSIQEVSYLILGLGGDKEMIPCTQIGRETGNLGR